MFKVVRMGKIGALDIPLVHELFLRGLHRGALNPEASIDWYRAHLIDANVGVFVGLENGLPVNLVCAILPYNTKTNRPLLDLISGDGKLDHAQETMRAALDFMRRAGYDKFWCFNFSKHSDGAYLRWMRGFVRKEGRVRATMLEIDF